MKNSFSAIEVASEGRALLVRFEAHNWNGEEWQPEETFFGWQFFDPETGRFIKEGAWTPIPCKVPVGESCAAGLRIEFPPEPAGYRIYVSPIGRQEGWHYLRGSPFLLIDAAVDRGGARITSTEITTLRELRWRAWRRAVPKAFRLPFLTLARNRRLIRSMARRDILARYRGSMGDVFWTILNPLLLMSTYFFVFGVVLQTRFGADRSTTGFALYFLAGMLPWLAFSEPAGRAPHIIPEYRNFVKKLIFPLETLPVNQVVAGMATEAFALVVFLAALLAIRHTVPVTVLWLPVLLVPQFLFTLGICWFLAAMGAFVRDLGQIMGFLLTVWFFITPICYPETSLPRQAMAILGKNPLYVLVKGYRAILLEGNAPAAWPEIKLWILAVAVFLLGHAWFYKLRKAFADVI